MFPRVNTQSPLSQQSDAAIESLEIHWGFAKERPSYSGLGSTYRALASSHCVYTAADGVANRMDFSWMRVRNRTTVQIPQMMRALQWKGEVEWGK
ncbi:hypothetical protein QQF64_024751 [Cirrhinus molitorella]|uniref:Uncharacterized protein n=1 Tax=Cirrhinus molitorella TaxID=172907 RepID=A0ABR3NN25_9TELE